MNDLTTFTPTNTFFIFQNSEYREMFRIDSNGCHVPDGVTVDEASQSVIDALDIHIKNLVDPYKEQRKELLEELERLRDINTFNGYNTEITDAVIAKARGEM